MDFSNLETMLLDGDGVLWQGEQGHPHLEAFFEIMDQCKIKWALLTNNNTRTADAYVEKLNKFGIPATNEQVFTSSTVTVAYIKHKY